MIPIQLTMHVFLTCYKSQFTTFRRISAIKLSSKVVLVYFQMYGIIFKFAVTYIKIEGIWKQTKVFAFIPYLILKQWTFR